MSAINLSDFFERVFQPTRLQGKSPDYVAQFTAAIVWLHRMLKRPPTLTDLTVDNVIAVKQSVRRAGFATATISRVSKRLCSLSLHAFRLGLLAAPCGKAVWRDDHQRRGRNDKGQFRRRKQRRIVRERPIKPQRPTLPPAEPGTVYHFYETTYRAERLIGASAATLRDYAGLFRALYRFAGQRHLLVAELTDELCSRYLESLLAGGQRASSVNGERAKLLAVWRFAVEKKLLAHDPRVRKLPEDRDAPDAWSEAEQAAILAAPLAMGWTHKIGDIPAGQWWRAILLVAYWTALRRSSLLRLRPCDIDLQTGWLTAPGSSIKNRTGKRFRLGADCLAALRVIWNPARPLIFPVTNARRIHPDFRALLKAANVPPSTRLSNTQFHKIRRTVATLTAVRRGLHSACDLLGHSTTEMTRRYVDSSKLPGNDATEFLPVLSIPIEKGNV